jgi:hypothetical protein
MVVGNLLSPRRRGAVFAAVVVVVHRVELATRRRESKDS